MLAKVVSDLNLQSNNQSIYLSRNAINTGPDTKEPPLTGAHKNNVSKSNNNT